MTRVAKPQTKSVARCSHGRSAGKCVLCKLEAARSVIEKMLFIGGEMRDICENLCQDSWTINALDRENMRKMYKAWDAISLEGT